MISNDHFTVAAMANIAVQGMSIYLRQQYLMYHQGCHFTCRIHGIYTFTCVEYVKKVSHWLVL